MIQKSMFELVRKKYKKAQAEKIKEMEKEQEEITDPENLESEPPPPREKKQQTVKEPQKNHSTYRKFERFTQTNSS